MAGSVHRTASQRTRLVPGIYDGWVPLPSSAPRDVVVALKHRAQNRPADPLLTWYDAGGSRVEFSARTFANWVDKTVNLLDELELLETTIANSLLANQQLHWMSLVTTMAIWQAGGTVLVGEDIDLAAGLIGGPELSQAQLSGLPTIACSLHPLGAGFAELPAGITDFAEVLAQPDVHQSFPPASSYCLIAAQSHSWEEASSIPDDPERRLITKPTGPWDFVVSALIAPLFGGGSVVLVEGGTAESIDNICRQERAIHA